MTNWQQRYDEHTRGWMDCLDYLKEKLAPESYWTVFEEIKKLFISQQHAPEFNSPIINAYLAYDGMDTFAEFARKHEGEV